MATATVGLVVGGFVALLLGLRLIVWLERLTENDDERNADSHDENS